jgi:hypothetical protein
MLDARPMSSRCLRAPHAELGWAGLCVSMIDGFYELRVSSLGGALFGSVDGGFLRMLSIESVTQWIARILFEMAMALNTVSHLTRGSSSSPLPPSPADPHPHDSRSGGRAFQVIGGCARRW